jgi:sec-independent protein translocase protein TatA
MGPGEILVILLVVLVLVLMWRGPQTLPKLGSALGKSIRELRREAQADDRPPDPVDPTEPRSS